MAKQKTKKKAENKTRNLKKETKKAKEKNEEISINIKPVINYFKKNQKARNALIIILLIGISMFFSIYFRTYSSSIKIADEWAYNGITSSIKNQITQQVNQEYPHLPLDRKQSLIEERYKAIIKKQEPQIRAQAKQQAELIRKEMKNDDGQTYLLAIDPYYYWRQAKNIVDHGYGGDTIKNGVPWNTHKVAPIGERKPRDELHEIVSAKIYEIVRFFNPNAKLFNVFFWMPVLIMALAVIPAFLIARKKAGNLGGFIASTIVGVHTAIINRTTAGFSDTDGYNILFPLLIFWAFIEAFEAKNNKKKLTLSIITGLLIGIYSRAWAGWWYIFDFAIGVMIAYLGYNIIKMIINKNKDKKEIKEKIINPLITTITIIISSGLFVTIIRDFETFTLSITEPIKFTAIQNAAKPDLWPNVFTTVAELNRASLNTIVSQIGGQIYFYLAMMGIVISLVNPKKMSKTDWTIIGGSAILYLILITKGMLKQNPLLYLAIMIIPPTTALLIKIKQKGETDIKYPIFLIVWFIGTIYASTQGVRFILLLAPAYSVALGILIGQAYKIITSIKGEEFSMNQPWIKATIIIIALLLLVKPISSANTAAKYEVPSMNDDWWASLTKIKQESQPNAIINSWWDFGHWFKAIADRAVTFDGASQNTPMAHWIGRVLSTSNEEEAIGILRMLDCGSRLGFEELAKNLQGVKEVKELTPETRLKTKKIIDKIILMNKEEAKKELEKQGLKEEDINKVLNLTHCSPPEDYFITSEDMTGKSGVWGHFGNWDFEKAYVYNVLRKEPVEVAIKKMKEQGIEEKKAKEMYFKAISLNNEQEANTWISPWPSYLTTRPVKCQNQSSIIICPIRKRAGTNNGRIVVIEQAIINLTDINKTIIQVGAYNQQTGIREGGTTVTPNAIIMADEDFKEIKFENAGYGFDIVLDKNEEGYRMIMADPELAAGMYTRLFFLEGKGTTHFEKFSDRTSPISGQRIIVWKVKW